MLFFVINRMSGSGKAVKAWRIVEEQLQQRQMIYEAVFSTSAEEARESIRGAARQHSQQISCVIVVGGDGTVHGLLPVLIETNLPLGIIPAGSGNDFARGLSIPFQPLKALQYILESTAVNLDCIGTADRYAMTVVGMGLDAEVARAVNRSRWKQRFNALRIGYLIYVLCFIKVLFTYRPAQVTLSVDGQQYEYNKVWLMATANLPFFGGGMHISPQSKANDATLDICIVHSISRLGLLAAFPKVFKGTHMHHPNIDFVRGSNIQALSSHPLLMHGDGELLGETPLHIQVLPSKLKVWHRSSSDEK